MAISEIAFIIIIALMLFGSKNIPEIARTLGKTMAQVKNATNEIKNEITKSGDLKELTDLKKDIENEFTGVTQNISTDLPNDLNLDITSEINQIKEDIEQMSGPIKRQR